MELHSILAPPSDSFMLLLFAVTHLLTSEGDTNKIIHYTHNMLIPLTKLEGIFPFIQKKKKLAFELLNFYPPLCLPKICQSEIQNHIIEFFEIIILHYILNLLLLLQKKNWMQVSYSPQIFVF